MKRALLLALLLSATGISAMEGNYKRIAITEYYTEQDLSLLTKHEKLLVAAKDGDLEKCKDLINNNYAYVNAQVDNNGYTPLTYAAENGHLEVCRFLLSKDALTNEYECTKDTKRREGYQKDTILSLAAKNGYLEICKLLVNKGADLEGHTNRCIMSSKECTCDHPCDESDFCETKCMCNADFNYGPLQQAVSGEHLAVYTFLINEGANIEGGPLYGGIDTPLNIAAALRNLDMCKLLVEDGADLDSAEYHGNGHNALGNALFHESGGLEETGKFLITQIVKDPKNGKYKLSLKALNYAVDGHSTPTEESAIEACRFVVKQTLIGNNEEVAESKLLSLLSSFKQFNLPKGLRQLLVSYCKCTFPYFISLILEGKQDIPACIIKAIIPKLVKRINNLKKDLNVVKKTEQEVVPGRMMRIGDDQELIKLLDSKLFGENFCTDIAENIKDQLPLTDEPVEIIE